MYTIDRLLRVSKGLENPNSTLDNPLEHLVACHSRIEERLATLERAAAVLQSDPSGALAAIDACFAYFESNGVLHTRDEEESVFPRLRGKISPERLAGVEGLEREHREADAIYEELKSSAAAFHSGHAPDKAAAFQAALKRFTALYRAHIAFENSELIAVSREALSHSEIAAISEEMKVRRGLKQPG